ncbi:hypothetical protein L1049_027560 [Liquidambar formosana]|uniref:Phytocyanin domain-containing protein n=1 Tax=Liquidambar formosana TaxID=63359 RepID=A0AAP0WVJ7_LIQFO
MGKVKIISNRRNQPSNEIVTDLAVCVFAVFSYGPIHDVLEVDRLDYSKCRTVKPISAHNDGDTVVPLTEAGTRYFICGRRGHCAMGLRLQLQVLPPPANNSTAPAGSSSSNSSSSSNGGSSGRKSGGRGNKQHPPPSPSNSPPPPGPNAEKEPSPPDTPPNDQAETPAPPSSGVGRMMTGGLLYWWLLFATMVISVTPLVTTSVTAFLSFN